jgi:HK97 family phage portal protein
VLISDGVLVKSPTVLWEGTPAQWDHSVPLFRRWSAYNEIYRRHLWVFVLNAKLGRALARLPLKVYERGADGRVDARDSAYGRLLANPSSRLDLFSFWNWVKQTHGIYGEAWLLKRRDPAGRPVELIPIHPTKVGNPEFREGRFRYELRVSPEMLLDVDESDLVPFLAYDPDSLVRGMSPLEPLRATLENEDAARRATSSFWQRGARPSVALTHPKTLSDVAAKRVKRRWDEVAAGADNTGASVVLEEGLKPEVISLSAEEAQYIDTRKLNREEVCAAYDVPPPVVHILDRATFSNITEQMRSMYRDTMAPHLGHFEAVLEKHLRGSIRPGASEPDFGESVYGEFLLDEVLRGDFEQRQEAYRKADYMTLAEKRRLENLPYIPGTDRIIINAATIPLDSLDDIVAARVNRGGIQSETVRSVMGRLGRVKSLDEVDPAALADGLNGDEGLVLAALEAAGDLSEFRTNLRALEAKHG